MKKIMILLYLCLPLLLQGQNTLSLEEAIKLALQNNYDIQLARNEAEMAANNNTAGNAGMLPQVNANAGFNNSLNNVDQRFVDGRVIKRSGVSTDNSNLGLVLNWTLFDGMNMFIRRSRLKELEQMGTHTLKLNIENTVYQLATLYYQLLRADYLLKVAGNNLQISAERMRLAENRYLLGSGAKLDFLQASVDYNAEQSALLRLQSETDALKMQLNKLLARDPSTPFVLNDSLRSDSLMPYEQLRKDLAAKNKSLQLTAGAQKLAGLELKSVKAERYPNIQLNSGYNYTGTKSQAGFLLQNKNTAFNYGLTASISLFNGFNLQQRQRQAQLLQRSADIMHRRQELELHTQLDAAFLRYTKNREWFRLEEENVKSARQLLDIALEKYRVGGSRLLELKDAQQALLLAESNLVNVLYEMKSAELELLKLSANLVKGN